MNLLHGLMGWLNSNLLNFAFQLRNGNAQVSLFELGMFPVNLEMVRQLASLTKPITNSESKRRSDRIAILNEAIFGWVGLGPKHRSRIADVLNRKEKEDPYVWEPIKLQKYKVVYLSVMFHFLSWLVLLCSLVVRASLIQL